MNLSIGRQGADMDNTVSLNYLSLIYDIQLQFPDKQIVILVTNCDKYFSYEIINV